MSRLGQKILKLSQDFFEEKDTAIIKNDCTEIVSKQTLNDILNDISDYAMEDSNLTSTVGLLLNIFQYIKEENSIEDLIGSLKEIQDQHSDCHSQDFQLVQVTEEILTLPLLFASSRHLSKDCHTSKRLFNTQLCNILETLMQKEELSVETVWHHAPSFYEALLLDGFPNSPLEAQEHDQYIGDYLQSVNLYYPFIHTQRELHSLLKSRYKPFLVMPQKSNIQ